MNERNKSIDVLKGIGIILVIMGHMDASQIGSGIIGYIYSFHMPLFFWITGYLTYTSKNIGFYKFIKKKAKSILVPYIALFGLSIFYGHVIVKYIFKQYIIPFDLFDTLKALVLSSEWLNSVPTFNFPLWFLPTLFITVVVFYFITKVKNTSVFIGILLFLSVISIPIQKYIPGRPPLGINVLPASLTFMGVGYLFRKYEEKIKVNLVFLIPMICFTLWASYMYPGNIQGIKHYFYFISAILSIYVYYRIANDLSSSKLLSYLGKNSLYIFGTHALFSYTYQFTKIEKFFSQYWNGLILFCINLLYILVLCLVFCYVIGLLKVFTIKISKILDERLKSIS